MTSYDYLNKLIERNKNILNNSFDIQLNKLYDSALYNGFVKWERV